jgi:hypothetical protein
MRLERMVALVCVLAAIGLTASPATAGIIWTEDFSSHPNLSSGNWHSNIPYNNDPASIGTWDTSNTYARAINAGEGTVGYTASNAQYMLTAADKDAFGSLCDPVSGLIGGGNVSGTVYVRYDSGGGYLDNSQSARTIQLRRGFATSVETLNATTTGSALSVGKIWGPTSFGAEHISSAATWIQTVSSTAVDQNTHTFVAQIDFVANTNDQVTFWVDPSVMPWVGQATGGMSLANVGDMSFDSFVIRSCNQGTNGNFDTIQFATSPIPEPSALVLVLTSAFGLLAYAWRKRR